MAQATQVQRFEINVLGIDVAFRSAAEPARIEWARAFIEAQYEKLKLLGRQANRDQLLMLLVMGIADDLLQSQQDLDEMHRRLDHLLSRIEETENARNVPSG